MEAGWNWNPTFHPKPATPEGLGLRQKLRWRSGFKDGCEARATRIEVRIQKARREAAAAPKNWNSLSLPMR